jgi:hypothetical protein
MPSATVTWAYSTAAKTGTAIANLIDDIVSAVNAAAGDANFKWEVASSNNASTPYYVVLKRKSGAAGRILLVCWTSSPAGANAAILEATPQTNSVWMAYFPAGNADTPSNLTASSGTIMGDDTGAVKVVGIGAVGTIYASNVAPTVYAHDDGVLLILQTAASDDDVVDGVGAGAAQSFATLGRQSVSAPVLPADLVPVAAGQTATSAAASVFRANRVGDAAHALAYSMASNFHSSTGSNVLYDPSPGRAWFIPIPLVSYQIGMGLQLKLRQVALGPPTSSALAVYNTVDASPAAIQPNTNTSGSTSPWLCNFKV